MMIFCDDDDCCSVRMLIGETGEGVCMGLTKPPKFEKRDIIALCIIHKSHRRRSVYITPLEASYIAKGLIDVSILRKATKKEIKEATNQK